MFERLEKFKLNKHDALLTTEFRYDPMESKSPFFQTAKKGREAFYKSEIGQNLKEDMKGYTKEAEQAHK